MEARSTEHELARSKRITGSRVKIIMTGGYQAKNTLSKKMWDPEPEKFYTVADTPNMPKRLMDGHLRERKVRGDFFFDHPEYDIIEDTPDTPTAFLTPAVCRGWPCPKDLRDWIGVSPDLVLGNTGVVHRENTFGAEIKSPVEIDTFNMWERKGCVPPEHLPQLTLSLLVTGWPYWWFVAYHPDAKARFEYKLTREEAPIDLMVEKIRAFLVVHIAHGEFTPAISDLDDLKELFSI